MSECIRCNSNRILEVCGKVSDKCFLQYKDLTHDGYVPKGLNIGDRFGDYIEFDLCLDCGQIQNQFPVSENAVKEAFSEELS